MQEAGADALLELAFTLADGLEYVRTGNITSTIMKQLKNPHPLLKLIELCYYSYFKVSMLVLMLTLLHPGYLFFGALE